jgi:glycosyltransferase involved in cell wall biosynthesis
MRLEPRLVVFSSLFPSAVQPHAGLFIRERMFRVGRELPLAVVSPRPWFPGQGLIRRWRPGYRPMPGARERQDGFDVYYPRFLSFPGVLRGLDGFLMALGSLSRVGKLAREGGANLIDAHFAYPDGYAATLLGRWLGLPVTITLRGTEVPLSRDPPRRRRLLEALGRADQVFSVSASLREHVAAIGADPHKIAVVGNGVDTEKFRPLPKAEARAALGLQIDDRVLITVGALVERKGFHRVIERLPTLWQRYPTLRYLVVGGPSPEGDWSAHLRSLVTEKRLEDVVRFLGPVSPDDLRVPLSAADVFVLATSNEGWANVLLEAMACGLPVVATDVGGNAEVVSAPGLGALVPFGDAEALEGALARALDTDWDPAHIRRHAEENSWDSRVRVLTATFRSLLGSTRAVALAPESTGRGGAEAPSDE